MDLGTDLDGFDDDERKPAPAADELPRLTDLEPAGRGRLVPLADLQREGFNTTPPFSWQIRESLFAGIGDVIESFGGFGTMLKDTAESLNSLAAQLESHDNKEGDTDDPTQ